MSDTYYVYEEEYKKMNNMKLLIQCGKNMIWKIILPLLSKFAKLKEKITKSSRLLYQHCNTRFHNLISPYIGNIVSN